MPSSLLALESLSWPSPSPAKRQLLACHPCRHLRSLSLSSQSPGSRGRSRPSIYHRIVDSIPSRKRSRYRKKVGNIRDRGHWAWVLEECTHRVWEQRICSKSLEVPLK